MDGWRDGWREGGMNKHPDGRWTKRQMNTSMTQETDRWMNGWMEGRMAAWMDDAWTDDGWKDEGWIDRWREGGGRTEGVNKKMTR